MTIASAPVFLQDLCHRLPDQMCLEGRRNRDRQDLRFGPRCLHKRDLHFDRVFVGMSGGLVDHEIGSNAYARGQLGINLNRADRGQPRSCPEQCRLSTTVPVNGPEQHDNRRRVPPRQFSENQAGHVTAEDPAGMRHNATRGCGSWIALLAVRRCGESSRRSSRSHSSLSPG